MSKKCLGFRSLPKSLPLLMSHTLGCMLIGATVIYTAMTATTVQAARSATTQAEAVAMVKSILRANADACKLKHGPVSAKRVKAGWRVTARVTLSGSGKPFTANAAWTVRDDGQAVPANQLTAEISRGCP